MRNILKLLLVGVVLGQICLSARAQGINYPGNVPANNGGAGNASTDGNNLFTRNNAAAMTEIEGDDTAGGKGSWRFMTEAQGAFYHYERKYVLPGISDDLRSSASIALPALSGEFTYTRADRKLAFGIGLSQTFGFESKLKDSDASLAGRALYFDTRTASNDLTAAIALRLHKKLSVGAAITAGRAFLVQIAPISQLAAIGIVRQIRIDVSRFGGPGAAFSVHFRPTEKVSFGANFKTERKYDLRGTLDSVQPAVTPSGLQFAPFKLAVGVPFRLPAVLETGVGFRTRRRFFIDLDYRLYFYRRSLKTIAVIDRSTGTALAAQSIDAKNVHLFIAGGAYDLNLKSKVLFGAGLTTNGLAERSFNPGLINSGGLSLSGGYARRVSGLWLNFGATALFAFHRTIGNTGQNLFPGKYRSYGVIFAFGVRR
jgi:long-subunit fatty acid transport protein